MTKLKVLIACEFSGRVRDAFLKLGHDAWSCDLLPTESPGPHFQGDVLSYLDRGWDLMIAHPPCTYLANSGFHHLHTTPSRWEKMEESAKFFNILQKAPIKHICIENPIPHKYARELIGKYNQIIHPWQFGHGETKRTCLWLKNLPPLLPTNIVPERYPACHLTPPSKDRWKIRSLTYQGIATALAEQFSAFILENSLCSSQV